MRPWTNKSLSLAIIGLLLVALGTSLCFLRPTIFRYILQKGLALSSTSESYNVWKDTSSLPPMHMNIYFFNWTNPRGLIYGQKPHLVQVGPYCFREVRQKINVTFHPENKTVSYFQRRLWYFDAEHSNGSLSDTISHLNVVAASATHKIRYWDYSMQKSLSLLLTTSQIYVVKTVDELLFTGYSDSLLSMAKIMADEDMPSFDRFGWFYMRNGTTDMDGHMNMDTGEDDISQLGILRRWNYRDTMKHFKVPCNIIEGSAGEFWPPSRTKDEISLFSVDLCRPLIYEYEQTVINKGIEAYRYTLDKKTLGNSTKRRYPHDQAKFFDSTTTTENFFTFAHSSEVTGSSTTKNMYSDENSSEDTNQYPEEDPDVVNVGHCYCSGECAPSGLINITACRFGAPVFVSLPHFHKTDPSVLEQVEGLSPNDKEHSFAITLEPVTGIPLEVSANLQVNVLLQPSELVSLFGKVPKIYLPILWFGLKVEVTDDMAYNLKHLLALPTVMLCIGIIMTIIGLCLLGVVALLQFLKKQPVLPTDAATEKTVDEPSEKKPSETMYMDKLTANEDANVRSDRRLYVKLY